jgi:DNA adenine methylase
MTANRRPMTIPRPFQYQGSKRGLAPMVLRFLPGKFQRLVEPFAGSAAMTLACAGRMRAARYWINDLNKPLAELLHLMINRPEELADAYADLWKEDGGDALDHFYEVRETFNRTGEPRLFLYLMARCVKGAVRYNNEGLFNQSPDKRRLGTRPETMRHNIMGVSLLLRGKALVTSHDFREVLAAAEATDVIYMDPPYQGTSGERDSRYLAGLSFDEFVTALDGLNSRGLRYAVSYDGRTGDKSYGEPLPRYLGLTHLELEAGRSTQATLLGREDETVESLYLSPALAATVGRGPHDFVRTGKADGKRLARAS